jgi:hypothetical protein
MENDLTDDDIEQKRDEWFQKFVRHNFPDTPLPPELENYRKVREHYLNPPSMKDCTPYNIKYRNELGQDVSISVFREIEVALLSSIFDAGFAMPEEGLKEKIAQLKEANNDVDGKTDRYAQSMAGDYDYNMLLCLEHAVKEFEANMANWLMTAWWFASYGLAIKTLEELRNSIRWASPPRFSQMRSVLFVEAQKRIDQMLGKTPSGPAPDYWGFTLRQIKAADALWQRQEKLTQEKLAEEMGMSVDALKQQMRRYKLKWKDLVTSYNNWSRGE